jgi:hypothetical protein
MLKAKSGFGNSAREFFPGEPSLAGFGGSLSAVGQAKEDMRLCGTDPFLTPFLSGNIAGQAPPGAALAEYLG